MQSALIWLSTLAPLRTHDSCTTHNAPFCSIFLIYNWFSFCHFQENLDIKMEHSYTRDSKAKDIGPDIPKPRTILIERTPPCPSCNLDSHDDKLNTLVEISEPVVPYDETASQVAMLEAEHTIRNNQLRSDHSDDDDWTLAIDKTNWSERQSQLFRRVERVLDLDQMARLAYSKRSGECLRRR